MKKKLEKLAPAYNKFISTKPVLLLLSLVTWSRNLIRRMYKWMISWAEKPQAEKALANISFAESSFFPIPPDPLVIAMVAARPKRWIRIATICTVASVLGGIAGYFIGVFLFETVGQWIINTYGLQEQYELVGEHFAQNAMIAVLIGGFTPIPYKLLSISAGAFAINFPVFVIGSILSRGGRFFLVAALMRYFGNRYKDKIEKYVDILGFLFILLLISGFIVIRYVL